MIIDSLKNLDAYTTLNPGFRKAAKYIECTNLDTLPDGKYAIDGENVFITVGENKLRAEHEAMLEVHDRYIDIQIVISGEERQGWRNRQECMNMDKVMDADRDIAFFTDRPAFIFKLEAGQMSIFFPQDAHAPLIGTGHVRKAVIKIAVAQ